MNPLRRQEIPVPKPVLTITVLVVALLFPLALLIWDFHEAWTPLEREYLLTYVTTARGGSGDSRLLVIDYSDNRRLLADDREAVPAPAATTGYALTQSARSRGAKNLEWIGTGETDNAKLHEQLRQVIYGGQSLWGLAERAVKFGLWILLIAPFTLWLDWSDIRQLRTGRALLGPRLASRFGFNRRKSPEGIGFETTDPPTIREYIAEQVERLRKRQPGPRTIRIPRSDEEQHILVLGDAGTGKSTLIRQLIPQIRARGEAAIIFDPALESTPHFYNPDRGDFLLNPVDARMPYWTPADEIRYAPESLTLARSLFPERERDDPEAVAAARSIFGWLIFRERPTAQQIAAWMSHFEEVDQRIAGTPLAVHVADDRPEQRARVRALFSRVATGFHFLPPESETTRRWSASAWSMEREGWLFLPGRPEIRDSLRPLISFWLDNLLVRLVNSCEAGARPVWVILDNLETLERLPQLPMALSEGRRANLRFVIAARSSSAIEARYGEDAEAVLGGPVTKILLRNSDPRSAQWASETIGNVEVEYLKDTEPTVAYYGSGKNKRYHLDRSIEPLVMDSAIQNLANLSGYLKSRNVVAPIHFRRTPPERKQPGFLPRMIDGLLPVPKPQPAPLLPSRERVLTVPQPEPDNRAPQERQEKEPARQAIFD